MGTYILDSYSLLHFSFGVIAYFLKVSFIDWTIIHVIFELLENTQFGIRLINSTFIGKFWPGGKDRPDSAINSIGDVLFGAAGWCLAYILHEREGGHSRRVEKRENFNSIGKENSRRKMGCRMSIMTLLNGAALYSGSV